LVFGLGNRFIEGFSVSFGIWILLAPVMERFSRFTAGRGFSVTSAISGGTSALY
jgi:hypothetical protein